MLALLGSQQSQIDSLNICGTKTEAHEEFTHKIQEKLNIMNQNWCAVQEKAYKKVHPHNTKDYECLVSLCENEEEELKSLLSELSDRLPIYEEELGVPLSLFSTSEIQWKVLRLQVYCIIINCSIQIPNVFAIL